MSDTGERGESADESRAAFPQGPPTWPRPDPAILEALQAVFSSGDWGRYHGQPTTRLAERLATMHAVPHAMPCSSGTIAVELALRGLGVGVGDEVVLAGYDFPGNFRAIEMVGARPVLADIDPDTWCLAPQSFADAIGPETAAVIVSHLHGGLAPMAELCAIAERRGLAVVEDACQSPGAIVDGRAAGSWGHAGILSFGGSKLLTAGRGGAVLTRDPAVRQRMIVYAERGNDAFPLSQLQAAVLLPQLEQLDERNRQRAAAVRQLVDRGQSVRGLVPVRVPDADDPRHVAAYYKVAWRFDPAHAGGRSRDEFLSAVQAEGVALDSGFRGFAGRSTRRCGKPTPLSASQQAAEQTVILHHPVLLETSHTIDRLADVLYQIAGHP